MVKYFCDRCGQEVTRNEHDCRERIVRIKDDKHIVTVNSYKAKDKKPADAERNIDQEFLRLDVQRAFLCDKCTVDIIKNGEIIKSGTNEDEEDQ